MSSELTKLEWQFHRSVLPWSTLVCVACSAVDHVSVLCLEIDIGPSNPVSCDFDFLIGC